MTVNTPPVQCRSLATLSYKSANKSSLPDLPTIPVAPDSPEASQRSFSALRVSLDTLPSEKRPFASLLIDSDDNEVVRKPSLPIEVKLIGLWLEWAQW